MPEPAERIQPDSEDMLYVNAHGVMVAGFMCETCGRPFSVTPAVKPEQWGGRVCLSEDCASYDPDRDVDKLFGDVE